MGNAGPFDFDLSDMDLSLTSLCEGSNIVRESLMDISFPLSGDSSCVGSAGSSGGSFRGGGGSSGSVGSGGGISGISSGTGVRVSGGGSSVGSGSGGGVAVVVAKVAALTTALRAEAVLLLSLLTLHLTLIQIQTMNSLMHYPIPIVSNVKLNIWVLILIIVIWIQNLGNQVMSQSWMTMALTNLLNKTLSMKLYSPLSTLSSQSMTEHKCKSCIQWRKT